MRHRKVLNLYDTDPAHEELLVYLENIEGRTRGALALTQMVLIGFRVMTMHESGDEAYYSVRNPDAAALKFKKKISARINRVENGSEISRELKSSQPNTIASESDPIIPSNTVGNNNDHKSTANSKGLISPEEFGLDDEYNTLAILKRHAIEE